jgi:ATP-dependent DNA ligase
MEKLNEKGLRKFLAIARQAPAVEWSQSSVPWIRHSPVVPFVSPKPVRVSPFMVMSAPQSVPWKFPFKPMRATWSVFKTLPLQSYIMEKKYDGWRAIVQVGPGISLWTREKRQITMPDNLGKQLAALGMPDGTLLDGEIWNMSKRGAWRHNKSVVCALTLWDAIRFDHRDLSNEPLETRRQKLEEILAGKNTPDIKATEILQPDETLAKQIDAEARSFREETNARSGFIHGVVLKRKGSPRRDNAVRSVEHADWIKVVFDGMQSGL